MSEKQESEYMAFDPEWYLEEYYSDLKGKEEWVLSFILDSMHDFFKDENNLGDMLLDVGTGPCLYSVVSACNKVKVIHLSDYLPINRQVLQEWKQNKREIHPSVFDYLLQKMKINQSRNEFIENLRHKITAILPVDVTKPNPIEPLEQVYDVITSTFCLDAAVHTAKDFNQVVKNVSSLLKINGLIFAMFYTQETFYIMKGKTYKSLDITSQEIQDIFMKNGFDLLQYRYMYYKVPDDTTDSKGLFALLARKITNIKIKEDMKLGNQDLKKSHH